MFGRGALIVGC